MAVSSFSSSSSSSWFEVAPDSDFSLQNLPLSIFSSIDQPIPRAATRLGDTIIDLSVLEEAGLFRDVVGLKSNVFGQSTLNAYLEHTKPVWKAFRATLIRLFDGTNDSLSSNPNLQEACFYDLTAVTMHLPIQVGDYTDFYSSREHATNVGIMFRGAANALQPNWLHLPVGYHGRSSTVFVSGTPIRRPMGQIQKDNDDPSAGSIYGPCRLLDFELEMAAVVGGPSNNTQPLSMGEAKDRIAGFMLMNDWSARDIQKWEYVPLGPFTAKNFATSVSPWIVLTEALEDYVAPTSAGTQSDPVPLSYLQDPTYSSYDVALTVAIQAEEQSEPTIISTSNFRNMYWNAAQQLVHHSVTGCIMKAGDLLGSGTISGSTEDSYGSMLELSWKGTKEVVVGDQVRKFLKDGDIVSMTGLCQKAGHGRIGFGECRGQILPALTELPPPVPVVDTSEERYSNFVLYSYWRSSSAWRVRTHLAAKAIPHMVVPINLLKDENKLPDYLEKNPSGQVPLLEFTDTATGKVVRLSQSVSIMGFLDSAFPSRPSLMPTNPFDKALALEMAEVINSGTQPLQNSAVIKYVEIESGGKIDPIEFAKRVNENGLKVLETLVRRRHADTHGPYCLGTFSPSVVDAFLVPQMSNARRYGLDVETVVPLLVAIEQRCLAHPWFRASHPSVQPDTPEDAK